jgi:hypothetical protein
MNCQVLSTLYVKANGEILCECDAGEAVSLGQVALSADWSVADVLNNEQYAHIRKAFAASSPPWGDVCHACAFLRANERLADTLAEKRITKMQVEPSLHCAISCPCCSRHRQIKQRTGPHVLDLVLFERLLESCRDSGYRVDFIEYCGQGEPLSHPEFAKVVSTARAVLPAAKQRLITNGNYVFADVVCSGSLDEIYVSCDGVYQESYGSYRINGSVEKALKFMSDAKSSHHPAPLVVWKYILFEFNDSDEELVAAQKKAMEMGIDAISFIVTHTRFKSHRFDSERLKAIPVVAPITVLDRTPIHDGVNVVGQPVGPRDSRLASFLRYSDCVLDEVRLVGKQYLTVRGWAIAKDGKEIEALAILCDNREVGKATIGLPRPDVMATYRCSSRAKPGFFLITQLDRPLGPVVSIVARIVLGRDRRDDFEVLYRFS